MTDLSAERTLVKSPPELWSELSELERLAKHLDAFGDIRITRLEPERSVAWEAECAAGTISLEPSGWGTKVTLTAALEDEVGSVDEDLDDAEPPPLAAPSARTRAERWMDRVFPGWRAPGYHAHQSAEEPKPAPQPEPPAESAVPDEASAREALDGVLDRLGAAHHRPFSRG
jgi:hypothetical protein